MINLTPHMKILLAIEPVDFRRGIDGLGRLCREVLDADPLGGAIFVFTNRRRTMIRLLTYDGQGAWLCQKRLSEGKFRWWPKPGHKGAMRLDVLELQALLWNGDPSRVEAAPAWRPIVIDGFLPGDPGQVGTKDRATSPV